MNIEFKAGEFVALRATTKFHLGSLERDIQEGDVIHFDGTIVKIGNAEHNLPVVRGAVKSGWLVLVGDTTTKYQPKSAEVAVRPAKSTDRERGAPIDVKTVHEEDRDLGNLKKVRDRGDGIVRKHQVVEEGASSEGEIVGKLKSPAAKKTTLTAENATRVAQEIRKVDNVQGTPDSRVIPVKAVATGDVQEARVGDELDELLGDAAVSSEVPAPGPAGEGDDPHLTAEEKETKAEKAADAARLEAARANAEAAKQSRLAQVNKSAPPATMVPAAAPEAAPAPPSAEPVAEEDSPVPLDLAQRVALVRAVIPNFEWDLTRPWKTRVVDAVKRYGKNPIYLNGILSVETDTVKAYITKALAPKA